jgi:hypothetical protein
MWVENGQVNGNGQPMFVSDAFFTPVTNTWAHPTAWSITSQFEHHFTPQFYVDLLGSVAQLKWSNQGGGCSPFLLVGVATCTIGSFGQGPLSKNAKNWIICADLG